MTEMIFQFDGGNFDQCQHGFRGARRRDYYEGDCSIDPADVVEVRADKKPIGACSIIRLTSRTRMLFRRTWRHIREDGIDLTVLWFVRHGSIRISPTGTESRIVRAGDLLLTRSAQPFRMECRPDEAEARHEVMHVVVPTYVIRDVVSDVIPCGSVITGASKSVAMARALVEYLFDDDDEISPRSVRSMLATSFSLLGDAMADRVDLVPKKRSITERRIDDVLRFIDLHLCNPNLSTAMVCKGCDISPRYLTTLLQMHGASFTSLVWDQRMVKAKEWLSTSAASEIPVAEVAHRLGFKSAAHFSRRFKQVYSFNPSDCRA